MNGADPHARPASAADIRLRGFSDRTSVDEAIRWIDAHARPLPDEEVELACAAGRILAVPIEARSEFPPGDRAAEDGYALRAAETAGANDYNPLPFGLANRDRPLPAGTARLVVSGSPLPAEADAIVPFEAAQAEGGLVQVFGTVAPGRGVERRGQLAEAGSVCLEPGRVLRAADLALLAALGLDRVRVVRQPRVRLVVAGPKPFAGGAPQDADGPMLRALIGRDGGVESEAIAGAAARVAMIVGMAHGSEDAVLVVGRTGAGPDDEAPLALAEAGELAIHGVGLRPGGSAGLGLLGRVPVVLLPGEPFACLAAYEIFAGRLIRLLGGRDPHLPHPVRAAELARKIVSGIGSVDLCQVRLAEGRVEPLGSAELGGLAALARADGFVLVPASLEGYAAGARVTVRLHAETGAPPRMEDQGHWPRT